MKTYDPSITLADFVYRHTFARRSPLTVYTRDALANARRLVLDDSMSAYMADLGWEAYKKYPKRTLETLENIRVSARLPHSLTWIEWNEVALATRASQLYGSDLNPKLVPLKTGWLLMQHPKLDTAFQGLSFGIGNTDDDSGFAKKGELGVAPMMVAWTTDNNALPWQPLNVGIDLEQKRGMTMAGMLTGVGAYKGPLNFTEATRYVRFPPLTATQLRQSIEEQYGMMRYIFALLATINDIPAKMANVVSAKGFIARGRYRKYLSHSVITLTVPEKKYRALARKTIANVRRRAHQVRGHWRDDWRHPGAVFCDHQWAQHTFDDGTAQECRTCKARRMWITEHIRGDASIGFVVHDFHITHKENGNA